MDGKIELSLDNLPIKRLDIIEENGLERFPQELDYEEKTLSLVRRIDFAWALERDEEENKKKKQKNSSETSPWPWQSMVENLQLAHQELSVVIDLINTVEANDAVTVAGMTRPKPLPNEVLSDLSVCTATKLQCFWHLGKYFKQSAKGLEQQIAREARFYGALIRLQQNWKVKRQRVAASVPSNEGFTFDLFDNTLYDSASVIRRSSQSTVRIDHDLAGMLTINLPPNLNHALQFGFHGMQSRNGANDTSKMSFRIPKRAEIDSANDEDCINRSHSLLREVHQAIFNEQVFNLVNREAFNPSVGYNVTGRSENSLQLSLGEGLSVYISLVPPREDDETEEAEETQNTEGSLMSLESFTAQVVDDKTPDIVNKHGFPNCISYEIYLQQIFHEHVFMKERGKSKSARSHVSRRPTKEGPGLLGHFSLSLAHRIFANKVLLELENVVYRVAYLHLISHPTWQSRTSSWTIFMQFPQSILHVGCQDQTSDSHCIKSIKSQFRLKVVVVDDCISIEGEDTPNVVSHFKGSSENISATNRYECDMVDLPVIILQQIASQIIRWLHEEALTVGVKAIRDFLSLSFELDQGETLSLVVHVDPKDPQGCISWSLVMEDDYTGMQKLHTNGPDGVLPCRKFLGYLSLDALYSALMELISVCNGGGSHLSA